MVTITFSPLSRPGLEKNYKKLRYACYFCPPHLLHWVCRHPKSLPEEAASAPLSLKDKNNLRSLGK